MSLSKLITILCCRPSGDRPMSIYKYMSLIFTARGKVVLARLDLLPGQVKCDFRLSLAEGSQLQSSCFLPGLNHKANPQVSDNCYCTEKEFKIWQMHLTDRCQ